jgi:hypothetical protein
MKYTIRNEQPLVCKSIGTEYMTFPRLNSLYFSASNTLHCAAANYFSGLEWEYTKRLQSVSGVRGLPQARYKNHSVLYKLYECDPDWLVGNNYCHMPCSPYALIPPPGVSDNPDEASHYHTSVFNLIRNLCFNTAERKHCEELSDCNEASPGPVAC